MRNRQSAATNIAHGQAPDAVRYVNRKGDTYYLHQGQTKSGKPKYYFAKKCTGNLCQSIPEGFEIYETPQSLVTCRRIRPKLIHDSEIAVVNQSLEKFGKMHFTVVDVKDVDIVLNVANGWQRTNAMPEMKFTLVDEHERLFTVFRWCYRGSIDGWIPLSYGRCLSDLCVEYVPHLNEESLFDLY